MSHNLQDHDVSEGVLIHGANALAGEGNGRMKINLEKSHCYIGRMTGYSEIQFLNIWLQHHDTT